MSSARELDTFTNLQGSQTMYVDGEPLFPLDTFTNLQGSQTYSLSVSGIR